MEKVHQQSKVPELIALQIFMESRSGSVSNIFSMVVQEQGHNARSYLTQIVQDDAAVPFY